MGSETLLEQTLRRSSLLAPPERTWIVAAESHRRLLRAALAGRPGTRLLLEPFARNTAAAIAWAAATALGRGGPAIVAVLPSDHHVPDRRAFARTLRRAADVARRRDALVLIGVEPTWPDPAYGYFRVGGHDPVLEVRRFLEKPDPRTARRYLRSGRHLWNAGIVVSRAERILDEVRVHAPEVWHSLGGVLRAAAEGRRVSVRRLRASYRGARSISFDHAVLERTRGILALRAGFPWSDLGSWDALRAHLPAQRSGNRLRGARPVLVDSRDNLVWNAGGRTLALLGVEGLVVVDTPDALLVCDPRRAQEVRRVVAELARRGDSGVT